MRAASLQACKPASLLPKKSFASEIKEPKRKEKWVKKQIIRY